MQIFGGSASVDMTRVTNLEVELIQANFKILVLQNASKYALKNMVIDVYNDTTGINAAASSNYTASVGLVGIIQNLVPTMTSNTAPSGTASASSIFSTQYDAWHAFDKIDDGNGWSPTGSTGWLQYQFPTAKVVNRYTIKPNNFTNASTTGPNTWTFQGSNDGTTWTTLDTQTGITGWAATVKKTFDFSNTTAYMYYRINITANNGNASLVISEMEMLNTTAVIASTTNTLPAAPTKIILDSKYTTPTPATDTIKFEISRDGGTTWTVVTPDTVTDISTQPTGTSLVSRVTLTSAATISGIGYSWQ